MQSNKHIYQIIFSVFLFTALSVGFSHSAHAQTLYQYTPLATVPIGNGTTNLTQAGKVVTPSTYITNLYTFAFGIGIVIAVGSGVWAGIEWMFGGDNPSKIASAKSRLQNVGWGFLLLLCSYTILDIINPQLVTFNLNLGVIDTANLTNDLNTQTATVSQLQALALSSQNTVAAQQQASKNAVQNLQTSITNLTNQLGDQSLTPSQKASVQNQLNEANTDLLYQQSQQSYLNVVGALSSGVSSGQSGLSTVPVVTSLQSEIASLQALAAKNPNDSTIQTMVGGDIQNINSQIADLNSVTNAVASTGGQADVYARAITLIQAAQPTSGMTGAQFETSLVNQQLLVNGTMQTAFQGIQATAPTGIINPEVQGLANTYTSTEATNLNATIKAQCIAKLGANAGC